MRSQTDNSNPNPPAPPALRGALAWRGVSFLAGYVGLALLGLVGRSFEVVAHAEVARDHSVEVTAAISKVPLRITLTWPGDAAATGYTVQRKLTGAAAWGAAINLPGSAVSYQDSAVQAGVAYEYTVIKTAPSTWHPGPYYGTGYLVAGIDLRAVHQRGKVLLVVDRNRLANLAAELQTLELDLAADGWEVLRHAVDPAWHPRAVKALLKADYDDYQSDPDPARRVKAVLLLGQAPIAYAGYLNPDGHPDHLGAWPADVYYGDMDGLWTDVITYGPVNGGRSNVAGDGRFDQNFLPSDLELQVGRVDLRNLPAFAPKTETDLLRQYLQRLHTFRIGGLVVPTRGLVDDNFGVHFGTLAYAANGWRNFAPLTGPANSVATDWFSTLSTDAYLWAYGCGPGWYQGAIGVGTTADFATTPSKAVFTMLFGSYFGDWDSTDNFLRAPLANNGYGLTCSWPGFPPWFYQHMALGESVGFSTRLSQNNPALYYGGGGIGWLQGVHVALMGDPTLRMDPVKAPTNLRPQGSGASLSLAWTAPSPAPAGLLGYYVYRASSPLGPFTLLTATPVNALTYKLPKNEPANSTYLVKSAVLESTPSGTYTNVGVGITLAPAKNFTPVIVSQPRNRVANVGEAVSFLVKAYGLPSTLTYQWYRNNVAIPGATAAEYSIASADYLAHPGTYKVRVANTAGAVNSANVTLAVNRPPVALNDSFVVDEGLTVDLPVLANDSDPDGNTLTILYATAPLNPAVTGYTSYTGCKTTVVPGTPAKIRFQGLAGFFGATTFSYEISDGRKTASATVTVTVRDTSIDPGPPHARHSLTKFGLNGTCVDVRGPFELPHCYMSYSRELADHRWKIASLVVTPEIGEAHFEYQALTGDFCVMAKVNSVAEYDDYFNYIGGDYAHAGVMVREGLTARDRGALLGAQDPWNSPGGDFYHVGALTAPGGSFSEEAFFQPDFAFPNGWVALQREGDKLTRFVSANGSAWTQFGNPVVIPGLADTVFAGIYGTGLFYARAVFSDYQVFTLRLGAGARLANGQFQFQIVGGPKGGLANIEASTDLFTWNPVGTVSLSAQTGGAAFTDAGAAGLSWRYYRVRAGFLHSVNAIGFMSTDFAPGFYTFANQFLAPPNTLASLIPSTLPGTVIHKFNPATVAYDRYVFDGSLAPPAWTPTGNVSLAPGEGAFLEHNGGPQPLRLTFIGELRQGRLVTSVPAGPPWLLSAPLPLAGGLTTTLGYFPAPGDSVYLYRNGAYALFVFDEFDLAWLPYEPQILPGESFFIGPAIPNTWTIQYRVWP